ncbi:hypothetical protein [Streptomyces sp. NPDC049881]|uniref:hypothetical protein n=1 Tax=Streptomyces sp. NPDC049881 TaxID=3155778 RepID=UPI0034217FE9
MTVTGTLRLLRASAFTVLCVVLAALGHVLFSGSHVPGPTLVTGALAVGTPCWFLAGRERAFPSVTGATVAAQAGLHMLFSLGQAHEHTPHRPSVAQRLAQTLLCGDGDVPLPQHEAEHLVTAAGLGSRLAQDTGGHAHHLATTAVENAAGHAAHGAGSPAMLAAHLLAAVLSGLWLAHGERAVFRLLRTLARWALAPLSLPLSAPAPSPDHAPGSRARPDKVTSRRALLLTHSITSRGPPGAPAVV